MLEVEKEQTPELREEQKKFLAEYDELSSDPMKFRQEMGNSKYEAKVRELVGCILACGEYKDRDFPAWAKQQVIVHNDDQVTPYVQAATLLTEIELFQSDKIDDKGNLISHRVAQSFVLAFNNTCDICCPVLQNFQPNCKMGKVTGLIMRGSRVYALMELNERAHNMMYHGAVRAEMGGYIKRRTPMETISPVSEVLDIELVSVGLRAVGNGYGEDRARASNVNYPKPEQGYSSPKAGEAHPIDKAMMGHMAKACRPVPQLREFLWDSEALKIYDNLVTNTVIEKDNDFRIVRYMGGTFVTDDDGNFSPGQIEMVADVFQKAVKLGLVEHGMLSQAIGLRLGRGSDVQKTMLFLYPVVANHDNTSVPCAFGEAGKSVPYTNDELNEALGGNWFFNEGDKPEER